MATRIYTPLTLKRLYGPSGNCCAYPDCPFELIYAEGNLSDICHIEALNPGGPRHNDDPSIDDKDRNNFPNLLLLCKNHHHIIDQTDDTGAPYYSTEQLKAMKQAHEALFAAAKKRLLQTTAPSRLAKIVKQLSEYEEPAEPAKRPLSFEIEEKIAYNAISRYRVIIETYRAYTSILNTLYNELEAGPLQKLLRNIHICYLSNCSPNQSADDTLDRVQTALIERLNHEGVLEYSEDLEECVHIIMVDAFMRCKILEEPPQ